MRLLLYIPILHGVADMGDSGAELARETKSLVGERRWEEHCRTVEGFWKSVSSYLVQLEPHRLKLYQDGMPAAGPIGRRIVEKAAGRGSLNYQLLLRLIENGAELRHTEEAALLLEERENVRRSLEASQGSAETQSYCAEQGHLLERRDRAMAHAVNSTLQEGEVGVLFVGAAHEVSRYLDDDVQVEEVKSRDSLRAYLATLTSGDSNDLKILSANMVLAPMPRPI